MPERNDTGVLDRPHLGLDEPDLERQVRQMLNRHPAVGLAIGVVHGGELRFFSAHGTADIASGRPITVDTVFRVASITKTFTAIAVMQLVEQGRVDLDAPAGEYLRSYRLAPRRPGWRPPTVRQLLTHTAGLGEEAPRTRAFRRDFGESYPPGKVPTLAEYHRGKLRLDAEPGSRFRYTDHGPATLGQLVEDVTGEPLDAYLRDRVFRPLGMVDTDLVLPDRLRARTATGYRLRSGGPRPVPEREWVTVGASNAWSTPGDMARYVAALLSGGANADGRVLEPATMATMFDRQFGSDPRLPGVGLAFFRVSVGGRPAVEHQGILPGFDSQIVAAPGDDVGIMGFTNGTNQGSFWLPTELSRVLGRLIGVPDETIPDDVPHHPEIWPELCGWYYLPGPITDQRLRSFLGAGAEVFVHRGELRLRLLTPVPVLYRGFALHPDDPDDPYSFRLDMFGSGQGGGMRVVFGRDPGTLDLDLMPLSLRKQPARTNPRRWATATLATVGAAGVIRRFR